MFAVSSSRAARASIRHWQRVTRLLTPEASILFQPVPPQAGHAGEDCGVERDAMEISAKKHSTNLQAEQPIFATENLGCAQDSHSECTPSVATGSLEVPESNSG